ncbi:MAG: carbon monoxide dehydrogenase [Rhodospirillaceae bacterium]|nr:carbon monoxide dehydrogenase [Rhodospirillaceae bacterium]|tara:strand:+ start:529 stop:2847 length:2319 start_codon:yes stop_codon:yes gene_type:complete
MDGNNNATTRNNVGRNAYVGSPIKRLEDLRLLPGRGRFVDDIRRDNLLHAVILRSPIGHGLIKSIDTSQAENLPGVHTIITAADMGAEIPLVPLRLMPMEELEPLGQPVIAQEKVRYVGEALAVVLANNPAIGEDALSQIFVEIDPIEAVANRHDAVAKNSLLFDDWGSNKAITYRASKGEVGNVFEEADFVRRERFATQRHLALPMEPRGILAEWDAKEERMIVEGAAKVPFPNRKILAAMMDIPIESIDLIESDVGGGFGARGEFFAEDFLIPFAARFVGRPVKWIEDRRDHLLTTGHAREMDCEIEIACNNDGTILGLRGEVWVDAGAYYRTNGTISPRNVAQFMSGPYRVPTVDIQSHVMLTNKAPIGTYRGPGRFETDFFRERFFDLVAGELGIDPVEFRRRNLVAEQDMPYAIATIQPVERKEQFDSGDYHMVLDRCLGAFGWAEKEKLRGQMIDGVYHGLAVGCFIEGGAAGPSENAKMVLQHDGSVNVYVGSTAVGQGVLTVLTQIAADALELPIDQINLLHGSTPFVSDGFGSYHSRSTVMGGSAILLAAEKLHTHICEAAADRFGCAVAGINLVDGEVSNSDGNSCGLGELAGLVPEVEETFHNHTHTYAYGTAAAHVTVDPSTGEVALIDLLMVEDVGKIVNPLTLQGQAIGAMVQGLGGAFLEHMIYDEQAQVVTGTLADYLAPQSMNFPNIRAIMLEEKPSPVSPLGTKGGGEGGILPMGGLMANAIASALSSFGVQPNQLPLSPGYVWDLIAAARSRQ